MDTNLESPDDLVLDGVPGIGKTYSIAPYSSILLEAKFWLQKLLYTCISKGIKKEKGKKTVYIACISVMLILFSFQGNKMKFMLWIRFPGSVWHEVLQLRIRRRLYQIEDKRFWIEMCCRNNHRRGKSEIISFSEWCRVYMQGTSSTWEWSYEVWIVNYYYYYYRVYYIFVW